MKSLRRIYLVLHGISLRRATSSLSRDSGVSTVDHGIVRLLAAFPIIGKPVARSTYCRFILFC